MCDGRSMACSLHRVHLHSSWRVTTVAVVVALLARVCNAARTEGYQYRHLSYAEIREGLYRLARENPRHLEVFTAASRFGLPQRGLCRATVRDATPNKPCEIVIAEVGERPIDRQRPQLIVVGSIHGDERLGAVVAFNLVRLMMERRRTDSWVARLVKTRLITVVAMPNPLGYDRSMRFEETDDVKGPVELVDPNADFPYAETNSSKCFRSVTARAINELFKSRLYRLGLIFHAGNNFIGYSWGDREHCNLSETTNNDDPGDPLHGRYEECTSQWQSPDDVAFHQLATHLSTFAGALPDLSSYRVGALNDPDILNPLDGGIADWAYSASFRPNRERRTCNPYTSGGYSSARSIPTEFSNRCLAFVVVTGGSNQLSSKQLGTSSGLYVTSADHGNGAVPRTLRLALMATDLVEPYVFFLDVKGSRPGRVSNGIARFKWSVGGAFTVGETFLEFESVGGSTTVHFNTTAQTGGSMWAQNNGMDGYERRFNDEGGVLMYSFARGASARWAYSESVPVSRYLPKGGRLRVRAVAMVDPAWAESVGFSRAAESLDKSGPVNISSSLGGPQPPLSLMVRSRSDPSFLATNGGFEVHGSNRFFSEYVYLDVSAMSRFGWYSHIGTYLVIMFLAGLIPVVALVWALLRISTTSGSSSSSARQSAAHFYPQLHNRVRRALRTFSRVEIREEIARIRRNSMGASTSSTLRPGSGKALGSE